MTKATLTALNGHAATKAFVYVCVPHLQRDDSEIQLLDTCSGGGTCDPAMFLFERLKAGLTNAYL